MYVLCLRARSRLRAEVLPVLVPGTSARPDRHAAVESVTCALSHLSGADDDGAVKFTVRPLPYPYIYTVAACFIHLDESYALVFCLTARAVPSSSHSQYSHPAIKPITR